MDDALREELLRMYALDQDRLRSDAESFLQSDLYRHHCARIRQIVEEAGWPTARTVGDDGANAAWLLVQHHSDLEFQKRCLPMVESAAMHGDASKGNYALLLDRVRVRCGEQQVYGSQFGMQQDGSYGPFPIEDAEHLDERRESVGLMPFAQYRSFMIEHYAARK